MTIRDLTDEERAVVKALRGTRNSPQIPRLDTQGFRREMRVKLGLGTSTINETIRKFQRATSRYNGPKVVLTGTLEDLAASWQQHHDDLVLKGASGAVIRHHREAIHRYCKSAGIDFEPDISTYERRSRTARSTRNDMIELPEDFLDRVRAVIHDVHYHNDPPVNAMYQHRARVVVKTAPRTPSEDARQLLTDIHPKRGVAIYRQSKISGPEGEIVLIPREAFDLPASILTSPVHKSYHTWATAWRPRLAARLPEAVVTNHVWLGPTGRPMDPTKYRLHAGLLGKTTWPEYYPYLFREIGIIMRCLEIIEERGHLDYEIALQWSGHQKLDNLRKYTRKARKLHREALKHGDLNDILTEWRSI